MKPITKTFKVVILSLILFLFAGVFFAEEETIITVIPFEQVTASALATAAPVQVEKKKVVIEKISTIDAKDKIEIMIAVSEKVAQKVSALMPEASNKNHRILVKLLNCTAKTETIKVEKGGVVRVRTAGHGTEAWVVLDLESEMKWKVSADGKNIIVTLLKKIVVPVVQKEPAVEKEYKPAVEKENKVGVEKENKVGVEKENKVGVMLYRIMDVAGKDLTKKTRVIITSDGPVKYRVMKDAKNKIITLNVVDAVSVWKENAVQINKGVVEAVTLKENKVDKTLDISIKITENVPYTVTRDQNQIILDIDHAAIDFSKRNRELDLYQKISINVQSAPMAAVLRMLAVQTGYEFVAGPSLNTALPVTLKEENQPFVTVLRDVLAPQSFAFEVRANMIKIGTVADIKQEKVMLQHMTRFYSPKTMTSLELKRIVDVQLSKEPTMDLRVEADTTAGQDRLIMAGTEGDIDRLLDIIINVDADGSTEFSQDATGGLQTRIYRTQYVDASVLIESLRGFLSTTGKIIADDRTGSVVVTDSIKNIKKIESVITKLDVKVRQVSVEAKMYEVNVNDVKNLGVQWGGTYLNNGTTIKGTGTPPMAYTPAGTLTLGFLQTGVDIKATLNALQTKTDATLLSSPKVTVQNNKTALIYTTRTTYYLTTNVTNGASGVAVTTQTYNPIELPIQLKVTPKITDDGQISMQVDVTVKKIMVSTSQNVGGPPDTSEQNASTLVRAKNNDTVVIGGMISDRISNIENKVPILGDIPLIGGLFKGTTEEKERVELVVFLTASIIDEEKE